MDNPIRFSDLFSEDIQGGLDALIARVGQVEESILTMLKDVKREASGLSEALSGTSSASKGDRDATSQYAAEIERLHSANEKLQKSLESVQKQLGNMRNVKRSDSGETVSLMRSYESLSALIAETGVNVEELLKSDKQLSIAKKNGEAANASLEGSYNRLYAQYNLIKNVLNAMGSEMRNNTAIGKKWEAQAFQLMNTMKAMQESTGKHTLSVGEYSKAFNGLNISTQQVLREMPTLANSWSQFFIAISNNVPIFVDKFKRVREETGSLQVAMKGVLTSVFSWQTALLVLLTVLPKIAKAIHNKKKAQAEDNEVAKAAAAIHEKLNKVYQDSAKSINEEISKLRSIYIVSQDATRSMNDRVLAAQALKKEYKDAFANYSAEAIALGKASGLYDKLTEALIMQAKAKAYLNKITELESQMIDQQAIRDKAKADLDAARAETERAKARLESYDSWLAGGSTISGHDAKFDKLSAAAEHAKYAEQEALAVFMQADRPLQEIDNKIEELRKKIPAAGLDFKDFANTVGKSLDKTKDYYWEWRESVANILEDEEKRALELNDIKYEHAIANMQKELDEQKKLGTLSVEQEKYMTDIMVNLETERQQKRWEIIWNFYEKTWKAIKERYHDVVEEMAVDEEDFSISGQYEKRLAENAKKLTASRDRLNTALEQGSYREAKAEGKVFKDLTKEKLELEEELQEALLKMRLDTGEISAAQYGIELAKTQATLAKNIANLSKRRRGKFDLATLLFGELREDGKGNVYKELTAEAQAFVGAFEEAMSSAFEYMDEWMDKRIEMAEVAVEAAEKEREAAKTALDYELEARANGYANNVELARKEYEEKLEIERQAIAERERLEKIQERINTATQVSSLLTATAELWAAHASIPLVGKALAIAATAAMWGSFAAAKIQAAQLANAKTYGEGGMEYIDYGGSHASGHDVDFGRTKDGRPRRIERGEAVAVINKKNVDKYGVERVKNIIQTLNNGTFEDVYSPTSILNSRSSSVVDSTQGMGMADMYALAFAAMGMGDDVADLSGVERGIQTLIDQNAVRIVPTPYGRIEYSGNNKRIIRNS